LLFGLYLGAFSVMLVTHPDPILLALRLPKPDPFWTRMAGLLVGYLGFYYYRAGRDDARPFIRASITARSSVIVFVSVFVLLRLAGPMLLLIGIVDAAGAFWTWWALRSEQRLPGSEAE
jgi:hypothetical protein